MNLDLQYTVVKICFIATYDTQIKNCDCCFTRHLALETNLSRQRWPWKQIPFARGGRRHLAPRLILSPPGLSEQIIK